MQFFMKRREWKFEISSRPINCEKFFLRSLEGGCFLSPRLCFNYRCEAKWIFFIHSAVKTACASSCAFAPLSTRRTNWKGGRIIVRGHDWGDVSLMEDSLYKPLETDISLSENQNFLKSIKRRFRSSTLDHYRTLYSHKMSFPGKIKMRNSCKHKKSSNGQLEGLHKQRGLKTAEIRRPRRVVQASERLTTLHIELSVLKLLFA